MAENNVIERIIEANPDIRDKTEGLREFIQHLKTLGSCAYYVSDRPEAGQGFRYYLLDKVNTDHDTVFTPIPSTDILRMVAGQSAEYMMALADLLDGVLEKTEEKD